MIGLDGCRQETARDKDIDLERRRHPPLQPATGCGRRREGVLSLLQRDERRPGLPNALQEGDTEWPSGTTWSQPGPGDAPDVVPTGHQPTDNGKVGGRMLPLP